MLTINEWKHNDSHFSRGFIYLQTYIYIFCSISYLLIPVNGTHWAFNFRINSSKSHDCSFTWLLEFPNPELSSAKHTSNIETTKYARFDNKEVVIRFQNEVEANQRFSFSFSLSGASLLWTLGGSITSDLICLLLAIKGTQSFHFRWRRLN